MTSPHWISATLAKSWPNEWGKKSTTHKNPTNLNKINVLFKEPKTDVKEKKKNIAGGKAKFPPITERKEKIFNPKEKCHFH